MNQICEKMSDTCREDFIKNNVEYLRLSEIYSIFKVQRLNSNIEIYDISKADEKTTKVYKELIFKDPIKYSAILKNILQNNGKINYAIPSDSLVKFHRPEYLGYTALHFAVAGGSIAGLYALLSLGADYIMKDHNNLTALRLAIETSYGKNRRCVNLKGTLKHPLVDIILDAHAYCENSSNPSCKNGLSHFHIACMVNNVKAVKVFLKNEVSVDEAVNKDSDFLAGYSPLHLAARYCSVDTIKLLLLYNADRHSKDAKGLTPLHLLIEYKIEITNIIKQEDIGEKSYFQIDLDRIKKATELILSDVKDVSQTFDHIGMTYFHVACTDTKIINSGNYMVKVRDINAAINLDSPIWPGYTGLHFAAHFSIQTFIFLLNSGANITAKNAKGITPLDICLERFDLQDIHHILLSHVALKNIKFLDGTKLADVIRCMCSKSSFDQLLKRKSVVSSRISLDSPIWPGFTVMHLSVILAKRYKDNDIYDKVDHSVPQGNNKNTLESYKKLDERVFSCVLHDIDFTISDANGMTPLHLAFKLQQETIVQTMLNRHLTKTSLNCIDNQNLSHFHIAVIAGNIKLVKQFLFSGVFVDSIIKYNFLWLQNNLTKLSITAESTSLHISIENRNKEVTKVLLKHYADPFLKNSKGLTPLHLAFDLNSVDQMNILLSHPRVKERNVLSNSGLSNYHIACYVNNVPAIESYLKLGVDINSPIKAEYKDSNSNIKSTIFESLLKRRNDFNNVLDTKHSHPKDLDFLSVTAGWTALHFAVKGNSLDAVKLLLSNGASDSAKAESGYTPLYMAMKKYSYTNGFHDTEYEGARKILECFLVTLLSSNCKFDDEMNITLFHVACEILDEKLVINLLRSGLNCNARIDCKSPVFPGYNALHILMSINYDDRDYIAVDRTVKLLLKLGVDPCMKNVDADTPIHLGYYKNKYVFVDALFQNHKITKVNPITGDGTSHFHLACISEETSIVEKYIKCGVNVNSPIDYFSFYNGGYTPLHFAMTKSTTDIVKVLLKYGADTNARDCSGQTPLHAAINYTLPCLDNIEIILRIGKADVNAKTIIGQTTLDLLVTSFNVFNVNDIKSLQLLLTYGARVNVYSPLTSEGIFAVLFEKGFKSKRVFSTVMNNATDLKSLHKETGRNTIHNVVSICSRRSEDNYIPVFEDLLFRGCRLDHRDYKDKTPLHAATEYFNISGIRALLKFGADINIADIDDKTPYDYCLGSSILHEEVKKEFTWHLHKLKLAGLYISDSNKFLYDKIFPTVKSFGAGRNDSSCETELNQMRKIMIIDESFTLRHFLTEKAIRDYPVLTRCKREAIQKFFQKKKNIYKDYPNLGSLINLQYKKTVELYLLFSPIKHGLGILSR